MLQSTGKWIHLLTLFMEISDDNWAVYTKTEARKSDTRAAMFV